MDILLAVSPFDAILVISDLVFGEMKIRINGLMTITQPDVYEEKGGNLPVCTSDKSINFSRLN